MLDNDELKQVTIENGLEFLRQISAPVDINNDEELSDNIKVLETYCKKADVLAMAAVQLWIPKRIIYLKNTNLEIINKMQNDTATEEEKSFDEGRVLINPVVIKREGLTDYWEACDSCLDNFGKVYRPFKITLEYYDPSGEKHLEEFVKFEATVLSHELDHLDGVLHMDVAVELYVKNVDERKAWRKMEGNGYNVHSETGDYEKLKEEIIKKRH